MFKYPLAVTIDTNIFDAAKFDLCDASPLKTLENYVKNGKIKVVLSDIVVRESKRHIADQIKKICGIMRKARAAALEESTEHLISTIGLGEILRIVTNKGELISKGEETSWQFQQPVSVTLSAVVPLAERQPVLPAVRPAPAVKTPALRYSRRDPNSAPFPARRDAAQ